MASFKDTSGRTWEIKVTLGLIDRTLRATDVDITQIHDPKSAAIQKLSNLSTLFGVLCSVCKIEEHGVSVDEFGDVLDEEACEQASRALMEAVIAFFPPPKRKIVEPAFRRYLTALDKKRAADLKMAESALESLDFEKAVNGDTESKDSAGNTPASSESPTSTD